MESCPNKVKKLIICIVSLVFIFQTGIFSLAEQVSGSVERPAWSIGDYWIYSRHMNIDDTKRFFDGTEINTSSLQENETIYINGTKNIDGEECYIIFICISYELQITLKLADSDVKPFDGYSFYMRAECYRRVSDLAFVGAESWSILNYYNISDSNDNTPIITKTRYEFHTKITPSAPFVSIKFPISFEGNAPWHFVSNLVIVTEGTRVETSINTGTINEYLIIGNQIMSADINTTTGLPGTINLPAGVFQYIPISYKGIISWECDEVRIYVNGTSISNQKSFTYLNNYTEYYSPEIQNILIDDGDQFSLMGGLVSIGVPVELIQFKSGTRTSDQGPQTDKNKQLLDISQKNDKQPSYTKFINIQQSCVIVASLIIITGIVWKRKHLQFLCK